MCLLIMAYRCRADYPLIIAANRDEFHERPTAALDRWGPKGEILAGRDLRGGGTWMGLHRSGRLAAITNYREPHRYRPEAPSRGHLVSNYLEGPSGAADYLARVAANGGDYNGFNLVAGQPAALYYYSNRGPAPRPVAPGVRGLSNHLLDTPWPKVRRAKQAMAALVAKGKRPDPEALLTLLADRWQPPDDDLPDTGIGLAWERLLSTAFIQSPTYGTRASSALLVDAGGRAEFIERTFTPDGKSDTRRFELRLPAR